MNVFSKIIYFSLLSIIGISVNSCNHSKSELIDGKNQILQDTADSLKIIDSILSIQMFSLIQLKEKMFCKIP